MISPATTVTKENVVGRSHSLTRTVKSNIIPKA